MNKLSRKRDAQKIVLAALEDLHLIAFKYRDKNMIELMIAISAIGGAFEDGWLGELLPSIELMVAEKNPELAEQIEAARQRRKGN